MLNYKKVQNCAEAIKNQIVTHFGSTTFTPRVALILGTGLADLADNVHNQLRIPYSTLPDYPASTVATHTGGFICGWLADVPVIIQQGRCHLYEGYSPEEVCLGVRAMALCGVHTLFVTNSAGALNAQFAVGSLMAITDHINLTGQSALTGVTDEAFGPRFPDMSRAYDPGLLGLAEQEALKLGIRLERGVYVGILGPQLETPAETRMLRALGSDAVGMSTVQEVIAARHMGLKVLGISCLSNKNLPDCMGETSFADIVHGASLAEEKLYALVMAMLPAAASSAACL